MEFLTFKWTQDDRITCSDTMKYYHLSQKLKPIRNGKFDHYSNIYHLALISVTLYLLSIRITNKAYNYFLKSKRRNMLLFSLCCCKAKIKSIFLKTATQRMWHFNFLKKHTLLSLLFLREWEKGGGGGWVGRMRGTKNNMLGNQLLTYKSCRAK